MSQFNLSVEESSSENDSGESRACEIKASGSTPLLKYLVAPAEREKTQNSRHAISRLNHTTKFQNSLSEIEKTMTKDNSSSELFLGGLLPPKKGLHHRLVSEPFLKQKLNN